VASENLNAGAASSGRTASPIFQGVSFRQGQACFREIGKRLLPKLQSYESHSILAKNKDEHSQSPITHLFDLTEMEHTALEIFFDLTEMEHTALEISYPNSLKTGEGFPVEAKLIGSQKMGAQPVMYNEGELESQVLRLIPNALQGPAWHTEQYLTSAVSVEQRPRLFRSAALKLTADDLAVDALTQERQNVNPLQAASWAWLIKTNHAGDKFLYLTVSSVGQDGTTFSQILPFKLHVQENYLFTAISFINDHWEWRAGTIFIPIGLFLWNIWMRKRKLRSSLRSPAIES